MFGCEAKVDAQYLLARPFWLKDPIECSDGVCIEVVAYHRAGTQLREPSQSNLVTIN